MDRPAIELQSEGGRRKFLSVYENGQNCLSTHVVLWVRETETGHGGEACAISLTPEQAIYLAHKMRALAIDVLTDSLTEGDI